MKLGLGTTGLLSAPALLLVVALALPEGSAALLPRRHSLQQWTNSSVGREAKPKAASTPPPLGLASYPDWRCPRCHSQGEFFCDPEGLLSEEARRNVTDSLHLVRATSEVECGRLDSVLAGEDRGTRQHFRLGLAIAEDWPDSEADPATLQQFGLVLMAQWGLMPIYNGVDARNGVAGEASTANCPNAAVLILLPRFHQVFLSAPSCEFICAERGGPEVAHAASLALEAEGLGAAALAGIEQVRRILRETAPLSLESPDVASAKKRAAGRYWAQAGWVHGEVALTLAQRACLVLAVGIAALGLLALAAYGLAPAPRKSQPLAGAGAL